MAWTVAGAVLSVPPWILTAVLGASLFAATLWWTRRRGLILRRRAMRRLSNLGEELVASRSPLEHLRALRSALPDLLGVPEVHLCLLDRASRTLRRVEDSTASGPAEMPVLTDDPVGFREKTLALCFRNRSLIAIPDTRRSPFFDHGKATPRSVMFVPMFAQDDLLGVMEISDARKVRHFSEDEQATAQHIGNRVAMSMKLLEQKAMREQACGAEKLEALCQLVAATASELNAPLTMIAGSSQALRARLPGDLAGAELPRISSEAKKAAGILSRLLRIARVHEEEGLWVDLTSLLKSLLSARQKAWRKREIQTHDLLAAEPVVAAAPSSYMERVFSSLLMHIEDWLAESPERLITLRTSKLAARAQADISWTGLPRQGEGNDPLDDEQSPAEGVLSLAICRDLIRSHAGEIRLVQDTDRSWRFEVELPLAPAESQGRVAPPGAVEPARRSLTALIVEPDLPARQALISLLGDLGHRAVPAASAEAAVDLVTRFPFHVVLCSAQISGMPWIECFERSRGHVDAFVLLTRGYDPALWAALPAGEAHALAKPVRPDDLRRLLGEVEARLAGLAQ